MLSVLRKRNWKGFTLIELMIVVAIIGILAAVAIPNFMKFQTKAKQTEAKTNLKGAYTAAKSKYAEASSYASLYMFVATGSGLLSGFEPELNNLYQYNGNAAGDYLVCDKSGCTGSLTATCDSGVSITTQAFNDSHFVISAIGNIDTDDFLDGWSIDDENNLLNAGITVSTTTAANTISTVPEGCNDVVY